ncbi:MAG: hypothetical protein CM15mP98_10500 [Paracoccaceae bacterium]|nr:MAG: hypothetical protein CM15mP98_10500 [Paracoccaceae bacterium]
MIQIFSLIGANIYLAEGPYKGGWERHEYRWKVFPAKNVKWPIEGGKFLGGRGSDMCYGVSKVLERANILGLVPEARDLSKSVSVYIDKRLIPCVRDLCLMFDF